MPSVIKGDSNVNLDFSTGGRITGDFSNATLANRVFFQNSVINGASDVAVIPNGTSQAANFTAFGSSSDQANTTLMRIGVNSTETLINSFRTGTGTYLPMTFYTGGSERVRITSAGDVGIGTSSPATKADIVGASGVTSFTGTSFLGLQVRGATSTNDYSGIGFSTNGQGSPTAKIGAYFSGSGSYLQFGTSNSYGSGVTNTAMTIDFSGNVGIGTSSPASQLDVSKTGDAVVSLTSAGVQRYQLITRSGGRFDFQDQSAGATRWSVDQSGNLLVGTTSASTTAAGSYFEPSNIGYGRLNLVKAATGTTYALAFYYAGTQIGNIANSTTATAYNTSSDYRLKENIAPMQGALAKVAALKPCTYTWKVDGSVGEGFIAHELQEVVPDCVTGEKDGVETYLDEDGVEQTRPAYQGIDTSFLVATLTAAIQELKAIVDAQGAEIAALKGTA